MAKKNDTYWNYRVFKKVSLDSSGAEYAEYGIIEVYYKGSKVEGYTADFIPTWGESAEGLKEDFALMQKAFLQPVVTIEDLEPKKLKQKTKKTLKPKVKKEVKKKATKKVEKKNAKSKR